MNNEKQRVVLKPIRDQFSGASRELNDFYRFTMRDPNADHIGRLDRDKWTGTFSQWEGRISVWQNREKPPIPLNSISDPIKVLKKLVSINRAANQFITYKKDNDLWHSKDYWATYNEVKTLGKGDCEDYAIYKLWKMHRAGLKPKKIGVIVGALPGYHAFASYTLNNHDFYILDNGYLSHSVCLASQVLPRRKARLEVGFNFNSKWEYHYNSKA